MRTMRIVNIAAYKFLPLTDLRSLRARLQTLCRDADLKGTILLSHEGINLFVAGVAANIERLLAELRSWPGLADLQPKLSETDHQPFRRMLVRLKKETIAFGVEGIDPSRRTSPKLSARELKRWLDEGRPVTLLDTRNDYEVKLGTFKNAVPIGIDQFRDFPQGVARLPPELKKQPIVVFCTGGIRCEKAGPYMEREGFESVFQLDGGILKYFEEVCGEHYEGECFVFDQRVGLDPTLHETGSSQCFNCQSPLSAADQQHPHYVPGKSCPYCFKTSQELRASALAQRQEQMLRLASTLPGCEPYDHHKPVNVPAGFDGRTLLETLCGIFPHICTETWLDRYSAGSMLNADGQAVGASQVVRAGERYLLRVPAVIEPPVNMRVEVLYEDEAIVVLNKPAPLPMHPGGRFYRNTLQYVLDTVYSPLKPRPAHRLDANTTGVVIVARPRHFASQIQPQFADGDVEKVYLVRVTGHPAWDEITCAAPGGGAAGGRGARAGDEESGLPARTAFRVRGRLSDGSALLEARPLTGRTNQLRIHLAHLGYPVCGDPAYKAGNTLCDSQTLAVGDPPLCLHAWRINFRHPLNKQTVPFTAPPPGLFEPDGCGGTI